MPTVAEDYYARLGPLTVPDPENGFAVLNLADALTRSLALAYLLTQATELHEPWEIVLHPDTCPEELLPWLAQVAGVRLRPQDTVVQQRARILAAAGRKAGTEQSVKDEVALTLLSGDPGRVTVLYPSRWEMTVIVRTADTPDPAAAERAARAKLPAGTILTFVVSNLPIIDEGGAARTIDAIGSAGTTIDAITVADWT